MAKGVIDRNGISVPTYNEVLADLQAGFRNIYGQDVYLEPDSQDGQLLSVFALAISDAYNMAVDVYNSFSPVTAQGTGLSHMVQLNGIQRKSATYSTVELYITGTNGTTISNGVVEDVNGNKWDLPEKVHIGEQGFIYVTATAQEPGAIRAQMDAVNKIYTPVRGWAGVVNKSEAVPGAAAETDFELRQRQIISVANPSSTVFEGTMGAVAMVPGVTRWRGYENDLNETDSKGIPAHSIAIVVEGGNTQEIAEQIALHKTPGTGTYGTTSVITVDRYGIENMINFFRPSIKKVHVNVAIRVHIGYVGSTADTISKNIEEYINNLGVGATVFISRLYSVANAAEPLPGQITFDIEYIKLSSDGVNFSSVNVTPEFIELTSVADVQVIQL